MSNKMALHDQASKYLTSFFELAEGVDPSVLKNGISKTSAKVHLGIARGNAFWPTFMSWVAADSSDNIKQLMDWKAFRSTPGNNQSLTG
jgi:hypothetical protein